MIIWLVIGALLLASGYQAEAQTLQDEPPEEELQVEWDTAIRGDRLVGEIFIGGQVVLRLRQDMNGLDVVDRTQIVAERLEEALQNDLNPDLIRAGLRNSGPSVELDDRHLVIVGPETARINHSRPSGLARVWANNLRQVLGADPLPPPVRVLASWYGPGFEGNLTANGEVFCPRELTAAHRELPFGTIVKVMTTDEKRAVVVRINDRGPFVGSREIDLSRKAAKKLGILGEGVAPVLIEVID